jgi:hypothetical protein
MSEASEAQIRERLARLEEQNENQAKRMDIVQSDIRAIRTVIDQMGGGRKLVMTVFAAIGAIAAIVATVTGIAELVRIIRG